MKRREKNLKKQTDGSRSNGAIERLGDLRCFSNNNKQLDADGDDDDDDDGDDDDGDDDDTNLIRQGKSSVKSGLVYRNAETTPLSL